MKKFLKWLRSWLAREDILEDKRNIKERKNPDYEANFESKGKYMDETGWKYSASGSIQLSGEDVFIKWNSEVNLLLLDIIGIMFSNTEINERANEYHMRAPAFNITVDIVENGVGGTAEKITYKESKVDKEAGKLVINKTMNFRNTAEWHSYEGNIVQLYRIYQKFCSPVVVTWSDEVKNKDIGESDEAIEWTTPQ